jgi:hypothetical protein
VSGRVWLGESIEQVIARRDTDACDALYFGSSGFLVGDFSQSRQHTRQNLEP